MNRRGSKRGKTKDPEQFTVSQPIVADLFDKLATRSGRTYQRDQHIVKPLRIDKQRPASIGVTRDDHPASPLSSPVRTTSTEAVDTEEGQEITKYLTETALARQGRVSAPTIQRTQDYGEDLPQLSKVAMPPPRQTNTGRGQRPASAQIDTSQSIYEELDIPFRPMSRDRPLSRTRSASQASRYFDVTQELEGGLSDTVKKAPMPTTGSAFVHYSKSVLDMLDRQTPRLHSGMRRAFSETLFPPIVYGITPEGSSDEKSKPKLPILSLIHI